MDKLVCNLANCCGLDCPNAIPHYPDAECESGLCKLYRVGNRRQRCECVAAYGYRAGDKNGLQIVAAVIVAAARDKERDEKPSDS